MTDGERKRAGKSFIGAGERWREVLSNAEGGCEVPVKLLGVTWTLKSHGETRHQEEITVVGV